MLYLVHEIVMRLEANYAATLAAVVCFYISTGLQTKPLYQEHADSLKIKLDEQINIHTAIIVIKCTGCF